MQYALEKHFQPPHTSVWNTSGIMHSHAYHLHWYVLAYKERFRDDSMNLIQHIKTLVAIAHRITESTSIFKSSHIPIHTNVQHSCVQITCICYAFVCNKRLRDNNEARPIHWNFNQDNTLHDWVKKHSQNEPKIPRNTKMEYLYVHIARIPMHRNTMKGPKMNMYYDDYYNVLLKNL